MYDTKIALFTFSVSFKADFEIKKKNRKKNSNQENSLPITHNLLVFRQVTTPPPSVDVLQKMAPVDEG